MKKLLVVGLLFVAIGLAGACSSVSPDPGVEAVLVYKPIIFGHGGVAEKPISTGRTYVAITTSAILVEMRPQQVEVQFDDLMSSDGVPLDFHAAVRFQVTDSVKLVKNFGADSQFFARNIEQEFRMAVRDAVKKRGMNEMAINASAADAVDQEVTVATEAIITKSTIPIKLLGVTLGKANPPDAIKNQRIATAEQEQRQNTERQAKLAEDQRKEHERSRAEADNAYRMAMSLSPEQFVQLKQMETLREVCAKAQCTFINGNSTGAMFTIK